MNSITAEQVEQIQTLLIKEYGSVSFYKKGTTDEDGQWSISNSGISEFGPIKDGDFTFNKDRTVEQFLEFARENELLATVTLTGQTADYHHFEDWSHLARYMGISDLVVLSVKVPKRIAEKFQYYATRTTTISNKHRELIFKYVIKQIKENAEEDAFR